jgi:hypothetical protein
VIGAKFVGVETLSITLIVGMFVGGIPEAAASASMLKKVGYNNFAIFALWSTVLVAGVAAAAAGKIFIGSGSLVAAPEWACRCAATSRARLSDFRSLRR